MYRKSTRFQSWARHLKIIKREDQLGSSNLKQYLKTATTSPHFTCFCDLNRLAEHLLLSLRHQVWRLHWCDEGYEHQCSSYHTLRQGGRSTGRSSKSHVRMVQSPSKWVYSYIYIYIYSYISPHFSSRGFSYSKPNLSSSLPNPLELPGNKTIELISVFQLQTRVVLCTYRIANKIGVKF